jgi:hypothetical protein
MSQRPNPTHARPDPSGSEADVPPPHVAEFIRFCHHRRPVGWPELYDEMCAVAGRREFNGWDHDQFAAHGLTFSLFEMPRLAGWVRVVLAASPGPTDLIALSPLPV